MTLLSSHSPAKKTRGGASGVFDPAPLLRQVTMTLPDLRDRPAEGRWQDTAAFDCRHRVLDAQIADVLGVSRQTIGRWRHGSLIRWFDADRLATTIGLHPALLWSNWYEQVTA